MNGQSFLDISRKIDNKSLLATPVVFIGLCWQPVHTFGNPFLIGGI